MRAFIQVILYHDPYSGKRTADQEITIELPDECAGKLVEIAEAAIGSLVETASDKYFETLEAEAKAAA